MAQETDKVVGRFVRYMERCGGDPGNWYVGLTGDARQALFVNHGVREEKDAWFYARAVSSSAARAVRAKIMASVAIQDAADEVDTQPTSAPRLLSTLSDIVYVYKRGPHTKP